MSIRLRRLQAEYLRLTALFTEHEQIRIVEATGNPPDRYVIEYRVRGLVEEGSEIKEQGLHRAQITLGPNYPREIPRCVMLTPVFHPNIDHLAICTEDIRATGQTLDQTIVFIGEMIAFQAYNLQSPRNGDAARWTTEHLDELPLEHTDLMPRALAQRLDELAPSIPMEALAPAPVKLTEPAPPSELEQTSPATAPSPATLRFCTNCGQSSTEPVLQFCANRHLVCAACQVACPNCRRMVCVLCALRQCHSCDEVFCADCVIPCANCQSVVCLAHSRQCQLCQRWLCTAAECSQYCVECGRLTCATHLNQTKHCVPCAGNATPSAGAPGTSQSFESSV